MPMVGFAYVGAFVLLLSAIIAVGYLLTWWFDDCDYTLVWIITTILASGALTYIVAQQW